MARKLLLADDSITIQKVVELVLVEEDFEIKSVSNGEEALKILGSFVPDVVLADIEMPKINGYQLCEKIKANPATATVPVILLAGAFEPIDEGLAKKVGADDSVIKPFESQELISKINAALTLLPGEEAALSVEEAPMEGEEALAVMEEEEPLAQPEAVEMLAPEEDLWAMEEIAAAPEEMTAEAVAEAAPAEEAGVFEIAEEETPAPVFERPAEQPVRKLSPVAPAPAPSAVSVPSDEELLRVFEKAANERLASLVAKVDLKDAMLSALTPLMKDAVEKVLWEVAPELVEKMLKEVLKTSISSLTKEVEKVIWETVPDLAGTMIAKEIEKIKSEF